MTNEINIIKHILIKKEHLLKIGKNIDDYLDSLFDAHDRMNTTLKKLPLQSKDRFDTLLDLHFDYLGTKTDVANVIKITDYALRRNQLLSPIIKIHFDEKLSIKHLLNETVDVMLHLKNTVPIPKCSYKELDKAYVAIDRFTTHGHYLPHLSKKTDEHRIEDVLLYLHHVHKTVSTVYEYGVMSVVRKIGWQN
jgi:hypothetical protein